jgi:phosphatidylcholine synthase
MATGVDAGVSPSRARRIAAWGVHAFTASGAVAGVLAILATVRGDVQTAFVAMAYTLFVDALDGTLARALEVKIVVPTVDGSRLDDVVDFSTYVIVPAVFLMTRGLLPDAVAFPVVAAMVAASGYGFSRTDAKTTDHFFTGFPSYWNIVVFYLHLLGWPPALNAAVLVLLTVLVFVPFRYVYPSRTPTLRGLTVTLGCTWALACLWLLATLDAPSRTVVHLTLLYPVYYVALSLVLWRRRVS